MIFSQEQSKIFEFDKKRMVVSASAGAGKTTTMIEYITRLVEKGEPVKRMLVLTFTKAAAAEMKDRLSERLLARADNPFVQDQIDELMTSDISTIHAFLEKLIRRNISNLPELESFVILDEKETEKLMAEAFVEALSRFKKQQPEAFENLFFIMRDLGEVKKIVFALHNFLSAQAGRKQLLESFEKKFKTNFLRARDFLQKSVKKEAKEIFEQASQFGCENEKAAGYLDQICSVLQKLQDFDFAKLKETENLSLPRQPILKDYDRLGEIVELKERANKLLKLLARYAEIPQEAWSGEQTEVLTKQIYALFKEFDRCFRERKVHQNALDFNDLEWQSELIISNPVLLEEVQDKFDYVFVDEYQDTNPVQEKLVKAIAEKGKFVAVGDPKQGIYGFRNATAKIILSDSENFAKDKDGSTFYLTENYRSAHHVTDFANGFARNISHRMKNTPIISMRKEEGWVGVTRHQSKYMYQPIVEELARHQAEGTSCVLTQTNEEAVMLTALLRKRGINSKLIQSIEGFRFWNLAETRYLIKYIDKHTDTPLITDETWEKAKHATCSAYRESLSLAYVKRCMELFEQTNKTKYFSDFKEFVFESSVEDFCDDSGTDVVVSTIHKAKGKEFDNVYMLIIDNYQKSDALMRRYYVGMTRARNRLSIHTNSGCFDHLKADRHVTDPKEYAMPEEIALQLSHKDVYLGFFRGRKQDVLALRSGEPLTYNDAILYNANHCPVAKLSTNMQKTLAEWKEKGYEVKSASVRFIVAWKPKDAPKEEPETAVLLADMVLSCHVP